MLSMPTLLTQIDDLPPAQVYLVAGPAASGKTTFSEKLAVHLNAVILSMDHYYVDEDAITIEYDEKYGDAPQWESPDAYDAAMLGTNIKELLHTGQTLIPQYSFAANRRIGYQPLALQPQQPLIIEGLYTIRSQEFFQNYVSSMVTIFVATDLKLRRARARIRDVEERGKALADFECRRHFIESGERRWGLVQKQAADCILDIHHSFSYDTFFRGKLTC